MSFRRYTQRQFNSRNGEEKREKKHREVFRHSHNIVRYVYTKISVPFQFDADRFWKRKEWNVEPNQEKTTRSFFLSLKSDYVREWVVNVYIFFSLNKNYFVSLCVSVFTIYRFCFSVSSLVCATSNKFICWLRVFSSSPLLLCNVQFNIISECFLLLCVFPWIYRSNHIVCRHGLNTHTHTLPRCAYIYVWFLLFFLLIPGTMSETLFFFALKTFFQTEKDIVHVDFHHR